jgi:glucose/arabinose dehydrogenase
MRIPLMAVAAALALSGCGQPKGSSDPLAGFGPHPNLPAPTKPFLLPMFDTPKAVGWPAGAAPKAPAGFTVTRMAEGLDHPRWLYVLPNGDVLVSESASEPSPADHTMHGLEAVASKIVMKRVGAAKPSPNRIYLLRDADGDGAAETRTLFAQGLTRPFGMTLVGNTLYVANDNGVVKYPYTPGATSVAGPGEKVFDLPGGPINHHWTKNVAASRDGTKLYATVGSNSNVGDNGMAAEQGRAQIREYDIATGRLRTFATGLRNPVGLDFEPVTGALWTAVNERDEIGADVPPDYMTSVKDGGFYGWPYSYFGQHVDDRAQPQRPDLVAKAIPPDYALGPHTASLGLVFYQGASFPASYRGGAFVGQHGSWNRKPLNGYRVVFVPFAGGKPQMPAQVFLSGFLNDKGLVQGRPVGVAVAKDGALLVVDDVGGIVWRVAPQTPAAPPASTR